LDHALQYCQPLHEAKKKEAVMLESAMKGFCQMMTHQNGEDAWTAETWRDRARNLASCICMSFVEMVSTTTIFISWIGEDQLDVKEY